MILSLIILVLLYVCYQDLKQRAIHLLTFVLLTIVLVGANYWTSGSLVTINFLLNCSYLVILMIILYLYFRVRFGSWNLLDKGLGLGDIVFWFVVSLYLEFYWFVIWFNASMILALLIHFLLREFSWYGNRQKIPLAGLQAIILISFIVFIG